MIAIDGPSASGKSSTAHEVATRLGLVHLNSGLLYRAITWVALRDGWIGLLGEPEEPASPEFLARLDAVDLELAADPPSFELRVNAEPVDRWLQSAEVTARVSAMSAKAEVRTKVNDVLRSAAREMGIVVDGRDIGTAVFPDAFLKVFLTAAAEERARRRLAERSEPTGESAVAREASRLRKRDRFDASRMVAPLSRAADAVELDSTSRGRTEVVDEIVRLYAARCAEDAESA